MPAVFFFFPLPPGWHWERERRKRELRETRPEGAEVSPAAELRALCSYHFQNTPSRFRRPRPLPGFPPPPASFAWRCPSPVAIGRRRAPPTAPRPPRGSVPPSRTELRAAGGLLNRGGGGGGRGGSGARSGDETAAPRVGEAGGQLEITSAAPTTAGPKVRRRRGARAPQQASGRRLSGGMTGVGLPSWGRRQRGEGRRLPGGLAGQATDRQPLRPRILWAAGLWSRHGIAL